MKFNRLIQINQVAVETFNFSVLQMGLASVCIELHSHLSRPLRNTSIKVYSIKPVSKFKFFSMNCTIIASKMRTSS